MSAKGEGEGGKQRVCVKIRRVIDDRGGNKQARGGVGVGARAQSDPKTAKIITGAMAVRRERGKAPMASRPPTCVGTASSKPHAEQWLNAEFPFCLTPLLQPPQQQLGFFLQRPQAAGGQLGARRLLLT